MSNVRQPEPMHMHRLFSLATVGALTAATIAVSAAPPQAPGEPSPDHRANVTSVAERICAAADVKPCRYIWFGENKAALPTDVLERMNRSRWAVALPPAEWTETEDGNSHQFTNGHYSVGYAVHGHIVISPLN